MNKNIFAFAVCFAAFSLYADNSTEPTETSPTFQVVDGNQYEVISLDHVKTLFITAFNNSRDYNQEHGIESTHDGILIGMNETAYFVKSSEFAYTEVISLDHIKTLFIAAFNNSRAYNQEHGIENSHDGIFLQINDTAYFVKASEFAYTDESMSSTETTEVSSDSNIQATSIDLPETNSDNNETNSQE